MKRPIIALASLISAQDKFLDFVPPPVPNAAVNRECNDAFPAGQMIGARSSAPCSFTFTLCRPTIKASQIRLREGRHIRFPPILIYTEFDAPMSSENYVCRPCGCRQNRLKRCSYSSFPAEERTFALRDQKNTHLRPNPGNSVAAGQRQARDSKAAAQATSIQRRERRIWR